MAIQLKVSNHLSGLAQDLCLQMQLHRQDVFMPHYIVTQTDGMNVWLKQQIAEQLGIAANIEFKRPNDIVFKVYQILGGSLQSTISRETLVWFIYQQMGTAEFLNRFPIQSAYFNVQGAEKDLKRMGLAYRIADLFDQYQIYRPEMVKEWNKLELNNVKNDWQAYLWLKAKQITTSVMPDKTVISDYILEQLKLPQQQERLKARMPYVYFFGLSIVTRYHLSILHEIAKICAIHFYILNPSPEVYWMDDSNHKDMLLWKSKTGRGVALNNVGNALLTGWGKTLQNTFRLLFRNEDIINSYETINLVEPERNTLLAKIQDDIFRNAVDITERNKLTVKDVLDGTITIQSNYTIVREVDALYHYLVHLIDVKREALAARDIVVMVNDINNYTPYIKAIFENAPYRFKYKIADTSIANGDNIFSALGQILEIKEDNFTAENVLQLLESRFIRQRFNIGNTEQIRDWVVAANIKFGIEGRFEDETRFVSWEYGLKRLMFGFCMSGDQTFSIGEDDFFPCEVAEGANGFELVKFCHFVEVLISSIRMRKRNRSIADWVFYVEQTLHNLVFFPDDATNDDYRLLIERLTNYNELNGLMDELVSFEIFCNSLFNLLQAETKAHLFISEGITFCSLIPMRSIPFKVIAMLGLNSDSFPRKEQSLNFNLITQKHELGDRNIKDNDKHLFLETLLSAEKYLYLSYLGKSVADNTEKPASILIDELIDYIQSGFTGERPVKELLITEQPLHSYSLKFNHQPTLYRYTEQRPPIKMLFKKNVEVVSTEAHEVDLHGFINFFKNGIKHYYNKALGIYFAADENGLEDTEMFELDALSSWHLKEKLLQAGDQNLLPNVRDQEVRKGNLPLKHVGAVALEEVYTNHEAIIQQYAALTSNYEESKLAVSVNLTTSTLTGTIDKIFDDTLVVVCWSSNVTKYMIEGYIKTLVGIANNKFNNVILIQAHKKNQGIYRGNTSSISANEAQERLTELYLLYQKGLQQPIPFTEQLYKDIKKIAPILEADDDVASAQITTKIEADINDYNYPLTDPYILKQYSTGVLASEESAAIFKKIVATLLLPVTEMFNEYPY